VFPFVTPLCWGHTYFGESMFPHKGSPSHLQIIATSHFVLVAKQVRREMRAFGRFLMGRMRLQC